MQVRSVISALLSSLLLQFFCCRLGASEDRSSKSTYWNYSLDEYGQFHANLVVLPGPHETDIEYVWDTGGNLLGSHNVDETFQLIAPFPERTLWMAHPAQAKTLEGTFLQIAREVGFQYPMQSYLVTGPHGIAPRQFRDDLDNLESLRPAFSFSDHLLRVQNSVKNARIKLLAKMTGQKDFLVAKTDLFTRLFDIVEPTLTQQSYPEGDGQNFNAFSLLATREFEKDPDFFLSVLKKTASYQSWNPIKWFYENTGLAELIRLAVISLVTHNHSSEQIFIKSIILKKGIRAGWDALGWINNLYEAERAFWFEGTSTTKIRKDENLLKRLGASDISFIKEQQTMEVKSSFLQENCKEKIQDSNWIPMMRTYHEYGGFIVTRLLRRWFLPKTIVALLVEFIGIQYKKVSDSPQSLQLEMIKSIYHQAAVDGLSCGKLLKLPQDNSHLAIIVSGRLGIGFNSLTEHSLSLLIWKKMKSRYGRVHIWRETSGVNSLVFLKSIVEESKDGDTLDIIAVHHGPTESFVPDRTAAEIEATLPRGLVRHVLSTGCEMWGRIQIDGKSQSPLWRSSFGQHMQNLGVKNYVIFANKTAHWWRIATELTSQLGPESDWFLTSIDFFDRVEKEGEVARSKTSQQGILGKLQYPSPTGRPIFGTNSKLGDQWDPRVSLVQQWPFGISEYLLKIR